MKSTEIKFLFLWREWWLLSHFITVTSTCVFCLKIQYVRLWAISTWSDLFRALFHISPQQLWQLDRSRPQPFTEITTLTGQGEFRYRKHTNEVPYPSMFIHIHQGFSCIYTDATLYFGSLDVDSWECVPDTAVPTRDRLYLHLFALSISLAPNACSSSSTSSSSLSSPGLNQQTTIPSFLTFSRGAAGYLWLLAAAFRNFCFTNVRLLSLISHVTFPQQVFFMFFTSNLAKL